MSDGPSERVGTSVDPGRVVGKAANGERRGDVKKLLFLLGGISLVLAIFNTIPLLPFDGGHAAIVGYEAIASRIKGRRVRADYRKLVPVAAVVLAIFLTLGLSAMFLDIRDAIGS